MKKLLPIIILLFLVYSCNGQNKQDLRNMKISEFIANADSEIIFKSGLLLEAEAPLFATVLLEMTNDGLISDTMILGQVIDLYKERKEQILNNELVKDDSFNQDSVFIRTPTGEKFFLGMGEISLEKLILRESKQKFPKKYTEADYNAYFREENFHLWASAISSFVNSDMIAGMLVGNIMAIMPELGIDLSKYRIGDIIEISKNIKNSDEMEPFIDVLNSMR